jgi:hypothetical protein
MSNRSPLDARTSAPIPSDAGPDVRRSPLDARYLTDGTHLYRHLGPVDGSRELIGLEDCSSLEVLLVCCDQLHDSDLRVVEAAPSSGE